MIFMLRLLYPLEQSTLVLVGKGTVCVQATVMNLWRREYLFLSRASNPDPTGRLTCSLVTKCTESLPLIRQSAHRWRSSCEPYAPAVL
jgi:hypothetical protein